MSPSAVIRTLPGPSLSTVTVKALATCWPTTASTPSILTPLATTTRPSSSMTSRAAPWLPPKMTTSPSQRRSPTSSLWVHPAPLKQLPSKYPFDATVVIRNSSAFSPIGVVLLST